jgi:hypothetical protein
MGKSLRVYDLKAIEEIGRDLPHFILCADICKMLS